MPKIVIAVFGGMTFDTDGIWLRDGHLDFVTVGGAVERYEPVGEIDVPWAISWADEDRDVSTWLGNDMQKACFNELKSIGYR
jgi:alpha-amylase